MTTKPKSTKICIGDKVQLDDKKSGWVKFVGPMPKKKGTQYGIELEKSGTGKTAGTFNKKRYFKCKSKTGVFVPKSKIVKSQKSDKSTGPRVTVGTEITVKSKKTKGKIRYIGRTDINTKLLYGIELNSAKGDHNGTVNERSYFKCDDKHGIFIEESDIKVVSKKVTKSTKPSKPSTSSSKKKPTKTTSSTKKKTTSTTSSKKKTSSSSGDKKKTKPKRKSTTKKKTKKEVIYQVGDKVEIKPSKKGQIKYIGEAKNIGNGTYYGIRLTEKRGTCDGYSQGHEFFKCPYGYGVYVQKASILKKLTQDNDFDFMDEEEEINKKKEEYLKKIKENSDKLQAVHNKFKELDDDGNKSLDCEEFSEFAFEVLGVNRRECRDLFNKIDVSNNNEISFAEFDNWLQNSGLIDKLINNDEETKENETNKETQKNKQNDDETPQQTNDEQADEQPQENNGNNQNNSEEQTNDENEENKENNEEKTNEENEQNQEETNEEPQNPENDEKPQNEENNTEQNEENNQLEENNDEPQQENNEEAPQQENNELSQEENNEEAPPEENNEEEPQEENNEEPPQEENNEAQEEDNEGPPPEENPDE